VEDHADSREVLVVLLEQLGYHVVPVATVAEGLEKLDGQHRAILGLNLPDGLGTAILERIRTERRPIRVAITSATSDKRLINDAHRLHAELILRKPININALLGWLNADDE
jgi:CheY-like chemotaxis protein